MKTLTTLLTLVVVVVFLSASFLTSCGPDKAKEKARLDSIAKVDSIAKADSVAKADAVAPLNGLSKIEQGEGYAVIFDGKSTQGWKAVNQKDFPKKGWSIDTVESALHLAANAKAGDIMFDKKVTNFELKLDWKVAKGAGSGVVYLAQEKSFASAPKFAIGDNAKAGKDTTSFAGSLAGLKAAKQVVNAVGEWNSIKILVKEGLVEHWQNGEMILEYHINTPEWETMVKASKFAKVAELLKVAPEGFVGLQDNGGEIWVRNIKIKEIK
jgi:hypothetical protein